MCSGAYSVLVKISSDNLNDFFPYWGLKSLVLLMGLYTYILVFYSLDI